MLNQIPDWATNWTKQWKPCSWNWNWKPENESEWIIKCCRIECKNRIEIEWKWILTVVCEWVEEWSERRKSTTLGLNENGLERERELHGSEWKWKREKERKWDRKKNGAYLTKKEERERERRESRERE